MQKISLFFKTWLLILLMIWVHDTAPAQQVIPLYEDRIPNSIPGAPAEVYDTANSAHKTVRNVVIPAMRLYLPEEDGKMHKAVIIFPGGGYYLESYDLEGIRIARTFVDHGIAAFVVKYRLPSDASMKDKSIGPLQDAQQAMRIVRMHAGEWKLDRNQIGIMGFSAGGHLASTAGTHFEEDANPGGISLRPDFMILVYPVISMTDSLAHKGSRKLLLGENPTADQVRRFSGELNVTGKTPPTFLIHAGDDTTVDVDNSICFYEALRHHGVPAEMHIYPKGGHGFVLKMEPEDWMGPLFDWLDRI